MEKTNSGKTFGRTQWRFWLNSLLQSKNGKRESRLLIEELKPYHGCFWMYFRMLAGQTKTLVQMLAPQLKRQSSSYQANPADWRYFATCCLVVFIIYISFVQEHLVLRQVMSLSAFVVDAVVIGDVTSLLNYHRDWAMRLFSVRKVGEKNKSGSLFCT